MYLKARLADFPNQNLSQDELESAAGYTILGPVGSGKTHLAVAILKEWIQSRRAATIIGQQWGGTRNEPRYRDSARFITAPELLLDIRTSVGTGARAVKETIVQYVTVVALVLDDFGAEKATDWSGETLYHILNRRIVDEMPTIVTSNFTLEEIQDKDPRIASRLGGLAVIYLDGADRRLQREGATP